MHEQRNKRKAGACWQLTVRSSMVSTRGGIDYVAQLQARIGNSLCHDDSYWSHAGYDRAPVVTDTTQC